MRTSKLVACTLLAVLAAGRAHAAAPARSAELQQAADKFTEEFRKTEHPYGRADALLNVKVFEEPAYVDFLVDAVKEAKDIRATYIIRHAAAEKIGQLKSEEALNRAVALLGELKGDRDVFLRETLVHGLALNPTPLAGQGILKGLTDSNIHVKALAARYAGQVKDVNAIPFLIDLIGPRFRECELDAHNALVALTGCKLPVDKKKWGDWWEANKDKVKEIPVPQELRQEEEIKSWPMAEDIQFACRTPTGRTRSLQQYAHPNARVPVPAAVSAGLKWLAGHQSEDGYWDVDEFWKKDPKYATTTFELIEKDKKEPGFYARTPNPRIGSRGPGMDLPATGLALMAFCGQGCTHRHGEHTKTVQKALDWMLKQQDKNTGSFSGNMYIHAICTHAVIELWGVTRDPALKGPAQKGMDFLCYAQKDGFAWRYSPKPADCDSSVSSWCSMAVQSGRRAGLAVPAKNLIWARNFWDAVTVYSRREGEKEYGETFYALNADGTHGGGGSYANTAGSLLCRIFMGNGLRERSVMAGAYYLDDASVTTGKVDLYTWFYATQALFQVGGKPWTRWEGDVVPAVLKMQTPLQPAGKQATGDEGSFWEDSQWISDALGRIGVTAFCCVILETYYFYPKVENE